MTAPTLQPKYAAGVSITITSAATLASAAAAGGLAIDNSSNLYWDATIYGSLTLANTAIGSNPVVNFWFAASEDGTNYTDNYGGTDAAITLRSPTALRGPFVVPVPTANTTYKFVIPTVIGIIGARMLPKKWGFIVDNESGCAFTAFSAEYGGLNPVYPTV